MVLYTQKRKEAEERAAEDSDDNEDNDNDDEGGGLAGSLLKYYDNFSDTNRIGAAATIVLQDTRASLCSGSL